jgi:hypothetical protein
MPKTSKQIAGEIERIESVSQLLGVELQQLYRQYDRAFAVAVKQQAIQASHYLCTHAYGAEFLTLSVAARSHLIRAMQRSIRNSLDHLAEEINPPAATIDLDSLPTADPTITVSTESIDLKSFDNPEDLDRWRQQIERAIRLTLRGISHKGNLLLIQASVLPENLPQAIIEASATADRRGDRVHNAPNIVSALMDTGRDRDNEEDEDEDEEDDDNDDNDDREPELDEDEGRGLSPLDLAFPQIVQIYAMLMRRTEVELSNLTLMGYRQQIDRLAAKLEKLKREYRQLRSQLTASNAAIAWQASWRDWEEG